MLRNIVAGVLIVALPVILLMSDRHWFLSDQHRAVDHVADIPADAKGPMVANLERIVSHEGVHVVREPTKAESLYQLLVLAGRAPPPRISGEHEPLRYGYSVREWSFLGMPFGWYEEFGYVVYTRNRWELVMAPFLPSYDAELHREVGRDLKQGFFFPFWAHSWGWLYVALLAFWGCLYHRGIVKWREAEGII
ncbi:hypothetical protein [Sphingomonas sp.]|uniref:hypothetical protein n=1 Tax=Sphingomonas sp. TaxID=28214 RepID=UPI0025FA8B9F|nr:hypothetical protein [Sphingomonas sp.]